MAAEIRFALRSLRKSPGFTVASIAVMALGIGTGAVVFSLVDQVLLHPPGVSQPERVVALRAKYGKLNLKSIPLSVPDFADIRDSRQIFEHTAIGRGQDFNYTGGAAPERLLGLSISVEWFEVFGAKPTLGRVFSPQEDQPNANQVVLLADAAWKRLFGGDPAIIGTTIELNRKPYRIIGVMPPGFRWPPGVDLWAPLGLPPEQYSPANRFNESFNAFARLRPGVRLAQANALIQVLVKRLKDGHDQPAAIALASDWGMFAIPMTDFISGDVKRPILVLLAAVGFVLLIACSNIAGLMLARNYRCARELAVRAALGAKASRLMRQVLTEALLLAFAGAAVGLLLAGFGLELVLRIAPENAAAGLTAELDFRVLLFAVAVAVCSALLFAVAPAWHTARIDPYPLLKGAGRSGMAGRERQRMRSALVIGETAIALMLLVGAGLFLRSLERLEAVNPGFNPHGLMTASLSLPQAGYSTQEKRSAFYHALLQRLRSLPGVKAAGMGSPLPFSGSENAASFRIQERPPGPGDPGPHGDTRFVSPGYFEALSIPLKSGRYFTDADRQGSEPVAIIDETLARQYWPGENPIGRHISGGVLDFSWHTIVGIVGHVTHSDLAGDSGKGVYYFSLWQHPPPFTTIVVKASGDPGPLAGAIQRAVLAEDPAQPIHDLKPMDDLIAGSLAPRRFVVRVLGFFAAASLLLAVLGLYGVISYSVTQRTQEIGVRVALGAPAASVIGMILRDGLRLAGTGVVIGLVAAAIGGRWLKAQLFRLGPIDPVTFASMALILIAAALLASYLPARRALRIEPAAALREE